MFDSVLCCHYLEILDNFWTRDSAFDFASDPENYEADPAGEKDTQRRTEDLKCGCQPSHGCILQC